MKTLVTDSPEEAASYIRSGDIAAFPTETVYGLGGNAFSEEALRKIFSAKDRPEDNPLIVHVASPAEADLVADGVPDGARRLMDVFFPGPLTVILKRKATLPAVVSAGLDSVGVRMPAHPLAQAFLRACGVPVAAPSANRSGKPSPTTWQAVLEDLDGRIPCILRGGRTSVGLESTVVDCIGDRPVVLRSGAVSLERLREVDPSVTLLVDAAEGTARSPGLRHRHYSPQARVRIVEHAPALVPARAAFIGMEVPGDTQTHLVRVCTSVEEYAHELFHFFRTCDAAGVREILCQSVPEAGLGLALMDRLRRAASAS